MKKPISIVVPCYNSEQSLPLLHDRLREALTKDGRDFELILVDDASSDGTWRVIQDLAAAHKNVFGLHMIRNFGQHNALLCGIREAHNPIVVTMDDDLQNPPEEVPRLLEELESGGYDVVYGKPLKRAHGLFRNLASVTTKVILREVMGAQSAENVSAFRAFRTEIRRAFADYRGPYVSIDVLLTWGARRYSAVAVTTAPRQYGTSNYGFNKLVAHAIDIMTGFSTLPLRIASIAGFVFMAFGLIILGYVLAQYFINGHSVPGFPFLASVIAIFSGVQLFALGIFGEYLARIHVRTLDRPTYVVAARTTPEN